MARCEVIQSVKLLIVVGLVRLVQVVSFVELVKLDSCLLNLVSQFVSQLIRLLFTYLVTLLLNENVKIV